MSCIEYPIIVGDGIPNYNNQIIGGCIVFVGNPSEDQNQLLAQVVEIEDVS